MINKIKGKIHDQYAYWNYMLEIKVLGDME